MGWTLHMIMCVLLCDPVSIRIYYQQGILFLVIGRTGLGWQTNLQEIMGRESFDVVRFDLGPFLRGQTRIAKSKVLINRFFLVLEVCNVKASYRKSCARTLLM